MYLWTQLTQLNRADELIGFWKEVVHKLKLCSSNQAEACYSNELNTTTSSRSRQQH
jgi:hypothetical protein